MCKSIKNHWNYFRSFNTTLYTISLKRILGGLRPNRDIRFDFQLNPISSFWDIFNMNRQTDRSPSKKRKRNSNTLAYQKTLQRVEFRWNFVTIHYFPYLIGVRKAKIFNSLPFCIQCLKNTGNVLNTKLNWLTSRLIRTFESK